MFAIVKKKLSFKLSFKLQTVNLSGRSLARRQWCSSCLHICIHSKKKYLFFCKRPVQCCTRRIALDCGCCDSRSALAVSTHRIRPRSLRETSRGGGLYWVNIHCCWILSRNYLFMMVTERLHDEKSFFFFESFTDFDCIFISFCLDDRFMKES